MDIRITTLTENTANYGFLAEWGLSILVEVDGIKILLDTGLSFSAIHNAQLMGIDIATIDKIVLSHGHADHTGGLRDVLQIKGEVEIIAHPDLWSLKYVLRKKDDLHYGGIPFSREGLEGLGARFKLTQRPFRMSEHVITTGEIPMVTDYEKIDDNIFIKQGDELRPDPLADDQALIIDTEFGLVVILGCGHRGIVNTLRHAQNITGKEHVYAAIGGTHLFRASKERLENTITDLKEIGVQKLGVSHCTGFLPSARLSREFGDVFFLNNAGTRFTLP
jgi:7,8-dihydropterin-6-yl-methyl-4-(beta-D-ribofuranosyl)aminobenzene 5'-phosphate synthase